MRGHSPVLSLTLRQLEYVVAVARFEGVSTAATALHVSQPSISVAIAHVEDHLGWALFVRRKGSTLVPTSSGRAFIEEARRLLSDVSRLIDNDALTPARPSPVVMGCFVDLAPLLVAPMLKNFQLRHPNVPVTMRVGDFEALADDLEAGRLDFAVTYDLGLDERFQRLPIASLRPHVLVGEGHRLARRKRIDLAEVAAEPLVLADQGLSISHVQNLFLARGLVPRIAYRVANLEIMRSFAANGMAVGISYTRPAARESYDGRSIRSLDISTEIKPESIVVASSVSNPPSRSARSLMDCVVAIKDALFASHPR
jgi:DNA-binding transcriptional LysR family regulator